MPVLPATTATGTLRERFIADLTVRGFTAKHSTTISAPSPVSPSSSSARPAQRRRKTSGASRSGSPNAA
jgi:hypothetical protein